MERENEILDALIDFVVRASHINATSDDKAVLPGVVKPLLEYIRTKEASSVITDFSKQLPTLLNIFGAM